MKNYIELRLYFSDYCRQDAIENAEEIRDAIEDLMNDESSMLSVTDISYVIMIGVEDKKV